MKFVLFLVSASAFLIQAEASLSLPLYFAHIADYNQDSSDVFVVHVTIGNPATTFNLTLDLWYYETLLIGQSSLTALPCGPVTHRAFDASRSTTYHLDASVEPFIVHLSSYMIDWNCLVASNARATYGRDDFAGIEQVSFGVFSNFQGAWNPNWPSDGVLGLLGPNPGDHTPHEAPRSTVLELAQKASGGDTNEGLVSFFLKGQRQVGENVGKITFGGLGEECAGVKYAAAYASGPKDPLNFRIESAHLGTVSQNNIGGKGLLGQSNILLTMPNSTFAPFMVQIGATFDRRTGRYFVNCANAQALPAIQVTASEVQLHFTYADYVAQTSGGDKCEVLLSDSDDNSWTFGNKLWEKYCVVLDYANARVGLSELPFNH